MEADQIESSVYLRTAKELTMELSDEEDRYKAQQWIKLLEKTDNSRIRRYIANLLIMCLQKKCLVGPFIRIPKPPKNFIEYGLAYRPQDIANIILKVQKSSEQQEAKKSVKQLVYLYNGAATVKDSESERKRSGGITELDQPELPESTEFALTNEELVKKTQAELAQLYGALKNARHNYKDIQLIDKNNQQINRGTSRVFENRHQDSKRFGPLARSVSASNIPRPEKMQAQEAAKTVQITGISKDFKRYVDEFRDFHGQDSQRNQHTPVEALYENRRRGHSADSESSANLRNLLVHYQSIQGGPRLRAGSNYPNLRENPHEYVVNDSEYINAARPNPHYKINQMSAAQNAELNARRYRQAPSTDLNLDSIAVNNAESVNEINHEMLVPQRKTHKLELPHPYLRVPMSRSHQDQAPQFYYTRNSVQPINANKKTVRMLCRPRGGQTCPYSNVEDENDDSLVTGPIGENTRMIPTQEIRDIFGDSYVMVENTLVPLSKNKKDDSYGETTMTDYPRTPMIPRSMTAAGKFERKPRQLFKHAETFKGGDGAMHDLDVVVESEDEADDNARALGNTLKNAFLQSSLVQANDNLMDFSEDDDDEEQNLMDFDDANQGNVATGYDGAESLLDQSLSGVDSTLGPVGNQPFYDKSVLIPNLAGPQQYSMLIPVMAMQPSVPAIPPSYDIYSMYGDPESQPKPPPDWNFLGGNAGAQAARYTTDANNQNLINITPRVVHSPPRSTYMPPPRTPPPQSMAEALRKAQPYEPDVCKKPQLQAQTRALPQPKVVHSPPAPKQIQTKQQGQCPQLKVQNQAMACPKPQTYQPVQCPKPPDPSTRQNLLDAVREAQCRLPPQQPPRPKVVHSPVQARPAAPAQCPKPSTPSSQPRNAQQAILAAQCTPPPARLPAQVYQAPVVASPPIPTLAYGGMLRDPYGGNFLFVPVGTPNKPMAAPPKRFAPRMPTRATSTRTNVPRPQQPMVARITTTTRNPSKGQCPPKITRTTSTLRTNPPATRNVCKR